MEDLLKYHKPEGCTELQAELTGFADTFKYFYCLAPDSSYLHKTLTPELVAAFDEVYKNCKQLIKDYEYYKHRAEYYKLLPEDREE